MGAGGRANALGGEEARGARTQCLLIDLEVYNPGELIGNGWEGCEQLFWLPVGLRAERAPVVRTPHGGICALWGPMGPFCKVKWA